MPAEPRNRRYDSAALHFESTVRRCTNQEVDSMSELADLQKAISKTRAERGFVTDPVKIHVLLTEEVGEIASEIKRLWSVNYGDFSRNQLKEEIADAFVLLAALATLFDIDIEEAVADKFFRKDSMREWQSAAP